MTDNSASTARVSTGISGLDAILQGGLPRSRLYLVQGDPGSGKTTLGLQFLFAGLAAGERVVYVSLSQSRDELAEVAHSHGWSLAGIQLIEFPTEQAAKRKTTDQTVFHSADVDLPAFIQDLQERLNAARPVRVVVDSFTEIRVMAQSQLRYRQTVLDLKLFLNHLAATTLVIDDRMEQMNTFQIQNLTNGVIELTHSAPAYGGLRRRLQVCKLRGSGFREGYHDVQIVTGGLQVFPRLQVSPEAAGTVADPAGAVSSGVAELDLMLGGGLDPGTTTLLVGPAGVGKSSLAAQLASAAAGAGRRGAIFLFEENSRSFRERADALGMDFGRRCEAGQLQLHYVNVAELLPNEFSQTVRHLVEEEGISVVVIDSVTGYTNAMPRDELLLLYLHELKIFLSRRGVIVILVLAQHGMLDNTESPVDVSYMADTILLLRHRQVDNRLSRTLAVIKKRSGQHASTMAELHLDSGGIRLTLPEALP